MSAVLNAVTARPDFEVAVIGTGFAGLCMAIKLKEEGRNDFVLIERGNSVGGTWRDNNYPGAACDVPSHLYSFSFEPNPNWSRKYPTQPELHAYLRGIAQKHGLLPHIRFNNNFLGAEYDETAQLWRIKTRHGQETRELSARVVVSGSGGLAEPKLPDVQGVETFKGHSFHSSRWDHAYDLSGKRVAVIGTGASSIQFVPEIAAKVGRLDVYQRTPNWIIPRPDRAYSRAEKWLFRVLPFTRRLHRAMIYWGHEARVMGIVLHPSLMKVFQKIGERHIRKQVKDPALRAKVTPNYTIGCKRILISNDWYPAISRSNVSLITDGIREIRENAVVTADGQVREVDCIIFGTGFYATENPIADVIRGTGGRTLAQAWANGEEAYLGTLVKGFPNLCIIVGPNTGLGHSSMVFMIETQVAYIQRLLGHLHDTKAGTLEVKAAVQDGYNRRLHERLGGSVWATGCKSWYQHKSGKITALWPGFTFSFWLRSREFRASDYTLGGQAA
jgi:cation diffusion facilitator CzcD-associated flavoprotein CzcO